MSANSRWLTKEVAIYKKEIRPQAKQLFDYYKTLPLPEAIDRAAHVETHEGKRHSHHTRKQSMTLRASARALSQKRKVLAQCKSFHVLIRTIDDIVGKIKGIGDLYVYDCATMIGASLRLYPRKVYLHSGTRQGAKELRLDHKVKYLDRGALPKAMQSLKSYECEDLLCRIKSGKYCFPRLTRSSC